MVFEAQMLAEGPGMGRRDCVRAEKRPEASSAWDGERRKSQPRGRKENWAGLHRPRGECVSRRLGGQLGAASRAEQQDGAARGPPDLATWRSLVTLTRTG